MNLFNKNAEAYKLDLKDVMSENQEALRDHFACAAMQELLSSPEDKFFIPSFIAENAYMMADAMLAEREKKDDSI